MIKMGDLKNQIETSKLKKDKDNNTMDEYSNKIHEDL